MNNSTANKRKRIKSYTDFEFYQNLYQAAIIVANEIVPKLPVEEKYGLKSRMLRACQGPCALIAEGFAKGHLEKLFKRYLNDAKR